MSETYYIIPKIGTGSWDNPIRPAYEEEIKQALGIRSGVRLQRKMDDPFDYKTGFGLYAFIDAPVGAEDVLESQPGVVRLGGDPTTALSALRFRALTNVRDDAWVGLKTDAQVTKTLTVRRQSLELTHGTDTTDFTDSDGTTWDSLSTNALTKTHLSGTDGNTTFDVSSNQGAATGVVGGGFYQSEDAWIQDGVTPAEDMVCSLIHVSGPVNSSNDWIKLIGRYNSSGHFFYMENQDQASEDTRLLEYISGSGANQLDTSTFTAAATSRTFQMTIATNGATDADIDCQVNGTDRINFSGTINAGLRSTTGHAGIYSLSSRNSAHVVDGLAMTNNDAGGQSIALSPVSRTFAVQAPSLSGSGAAPVTPSPVSRTHTVNAPVLAGSGVASVAPSSVSRAQLAQAPSLSGSGSSNIAPSPVSRSQTVVAPVLAATGAMHILLSPVDRVLSLVAPSLSGSGIAPITPSPVSRTQAVNAPSISGSGSVSLSLSPVGRTMTVVAVIIAAPPVVTLSPLSRAMTVVSPSISGSGSSQVSPSPVSRQMQVVAVSLDATGAAIISFSPISRAMTVVSPDLSTVLRVAAVTLAAATRSGNLTASARSLTLTAKEHN